MQISLICTRHFAVSFAPTTTQIGGSRVLAIASDRDTALQPLKGASKRPDRRLSAAEDRASYVPDHIQLCAGWDGSAAKAPTACSFTRMSPTWLTCISSWCTA